jgi:N-acetylglutamate synthase
MSAAPAPTGVSVRQMFGADWLTDYEAVTRLWTDSGLPFRPQGRDRADKVAVELERGTATFLLAEAGGRLAGVVVATHDGRKGWINRLAVAPAYRRRGIAALLVREAEACLAAAGMEITAALIETQNEDSLAFFRSIGYVHDPHIEYVSKRRSAET